MQDVLTKKADTLAHEVYRVTRQFPKSELYGVISQLRRAALSIVLNVIEGFTRSSSKEHFRFLETAYGSLKEAKYLLYFSFKESYIYNEEYNKIINLAEEVGKLIWTKMSRVKKQAS